MKLLQEVLVIAGIIIFSLSNAEAQIRSANINWAEMQKNGMHKKFFPELKHQKVDWAKKLKMSEAQKEELQKIYAESKMETLELMQQIETAHQKLKELRDEENKKIRKILDEKQQVKFDRYKKLMAKYEGQPKPKKDKEKKHLGQ